ncbi:monoacylglycerol oacyltransferase [Plasmopara halstedii]|uniref:diacylglycerol O-acyltransferase n=1 Tax=Plasmopara halstedii TaxID=4781 RepID=A0A0N7L5R0_PLAHL|nr:monoacylglycerol oacyltransferase [Plasmopara halstedii]CEG42171.1 monoacylglycerol oacyltransferase [Plasmopara halstedii]|eukprot:XP_024578540.1 monoacylglycerol oacyltransferase [Plasmopara halstedii]
MKLQKCTWLHGICLAVAAISLCVAIELTGKRAWPWFATFIGHSMAHIPATLEFEESIDASKQYIFCSHPHGLLSTHHGLLLSGQTVPPFNAMIPLSTRRHLAASVCFRVPFYREYLLWSGCVDARRSVAEQMLQDGKSLVIMVGGIAEQMLSQRGDHTIYVKKRKGHIRLALKYGVPIVPGYAFGETDLFTHSSLLLSFRQFIARKFSVALLLGHGYSKWMFWLPHKGVTINHIFGKPISVEKIDDPSASDIEKLHDQYTCELIRIFDENKVKHGYGDCTLQVR